MHEIIRRLHADGWRLWHSGPGVLFLIRGAVDLNTAWERVCAEHEAGGRPWSGDRGWLALLDPLFEARWSLDVETVQPN